MTDLTKIDVGEIVVRLSELSIKIGRIKKKYAIAADQDCAPLIQDRQALRDELIRRGDDELIERGNEGSK